MAIKKVSISITKFYVLSWLFGLIALFWCYSSHYILMGIFTILFYSYSVADYHHPPSTLDDDGPPSNDDINPAV